MGLHARRHARLFPAGKPTDNAGPGRLGNSGFISVFRGADQREDGQMKQARFTQDYLLWSRV
jgi:hypothetical protein